MPSLDVLLFRTAFVAALGSGLMAGLFFVFSNFMMRALAALPPAQGMAAMQSINLRILNPVFLGVFLGTALLCVAVIVLALMQRQAAGALWLLLAGSLYLVGGLLVTIIGNVPLNDALAAARPETPEGARLWSEYLRTWTAWNHVRSVACLGSVTAFLLGLCRLGG